MKPFEHVVFWHSPEKKYRMFTNTNTSEKFMIYKKIIIDLK